MKILLNDPTPTTYKYININSQTGQIDLVIPVIPETSLREQPQLIALLDGSTIDELESYASLLELHIALLQDGKQRQEKTQRLNGINRFIEKLHAWIKLGKDTVIYEIHSQANKNKKNNISELFFNLNTATSEISISLTENIQNTETSEPLSQNTSSLVSSVNIELEPAENIELEPAELMNKLKDMSWERLERLPKDILTQCSHEPAYKNRKFFYDVARSKKDDATTVLNSYNAQQQQQQDLLKQNGKFIDDSGRQFDCTAYEYAYWAKDTDMCKMLEQHMVNDTKTELLKKINTIKDSGLSYQQHEQLYKNSHYDMRCVLKDLSLDEFNHLQTLITPHNEKIKNATENNYTTISFTENEYKNLKQELAQQKVRVFMPSCSAAFQRLCYLAYPMFFITSLFIPSPTETLSKKLKFDFFSLNTAVNTCLNYNQSELIHLSSAKLLRDVKTALLDVPTWLKQKNEITQKINSLEQNSRWREQNIIATVKETVKILGDLDASATTYLKTVLQTIDIDQHQTSTPIHSFSIGR